MDELSQWFQQTAGNVISAATAAKYTQPYELEKLRIQAASDNGYRTSGQAGAASAVGSVSPTVLIGGLALVGVALFFLVKD